MPDLGRKTIKIAGESGQGVNSIGEMLALALKRSGYYVFAYREYPSLIKGGYANYQVDFTDMKINSSSKFCDVAICLSRVSLHKIVSDINENGILIHWMNRFNFTDEEKKIIDERKINVVHIDAKKIVEENLGGKKIMINTFLVGVAWNIFGQEMTVVKDAFKEQFEDKPEILDKNLEVLDAGFEYSLPEGVENINVDFKIDAGQKDSLLLTGNQAIALGAISAGIRAYYAYPMTPASSILSYLANTYHETKILVKQAEDEITAAQMTLGSMHMGTRALVATSGGGFDLMTETVSLAMITEIPFVCVIAQRPGPATGVPTWTSAGDLNIAIYGGHGENPRCVIAASDIESAYLAVQNAFNIAEKYQIPVFVLTEKQIAESLFNVKKMPEALPIERGLLFNSIEGETSASRLQDMKSPSRFEITESGISPRWLPGQSDQTYNANSDEHFENGRLTEEGEEIIQMMDKRMRKMSYLVEEMPEPELYGEESGEILFVGWGSVKNAVLDAINCKLSNVKCSYLHYEVVYPIKAEKLLELKDKFDEVVLVENNYTGQLGHQIKLETGYEFEEKLLKYDGRPFFVEDILEYIK